MWHEIRDLGDLTGSKYDDRDLIRIIQETFGEATLDDLLPRHELVPSFDLDNQALPPAPRMWKPKFFHNFKGADSDGQEKIADVALRRSAAPTYFPAYQGYVDGGVVANNPAMSALAQAIDPATGGQQVANLRLFSIGTGLHPSVCPRRYAGLGTGTIGTIACDMMIEGMMGVADYECARLLGDKYFRLGPLLPAPVPLDCAEKISSLIHTLKV